MKMPELAWLRCHTRVNPVSLDESKRERQGEIAKEETKAMSAWQAGIPG